MLGIHVVLAKSDGDAGFALPFPVEDPPFDPDSLSQASIDAAPVVAIPPAGLIATQPGADPDKLDDMAHERDGQSAKPNVMRDGYPLVVQVGEHRYIVDGHHRIATALMAGDATVDVALLTLDIHKADALVDDPERIPVTERPLAKLDPADVPDEAFVGLNADWYDGGPTPVTRVGLLVRNTGQHKAQSSRGVTYLATTAARAADYARQYAHPMVLRVDCRKLKDWRFREDPLDAVPPGEPREQIAYAGTIPPSAITVMPDETWQDAPDVPAPDAAIAKYSPDQPRGENGRFESDGTAVESVDVGSLRPEKALPTSGLAAYEAEIKSGRFAPIQVTTDDDPVGPNVIVDGHHRYAAAIRMGLSRVPIQRSSRVYASLESWLKKDWDYGPIFKDWDDSKHPRAENGRFSDGEDVSGRSWTNLAGDRQLPRVSSADIVASPLRREPEGRSIMDVRSRALDNAAIDRAPVQDVTVDNLYGWQTAIMGSQLQPYDAGKASPISVVHFEGRDVVYNGNHRAAAAWASHVSTMPAHVLNLDDPKNGRYLKPEYRSAIRKDEGDESDLPWDDWGDEVDQMFGRWWDQLVTTAGQAVDGAWTMSADQQRYSAAYVKQRAAQLMAATQDVARSIGQAAAEAGLDRDKIREFLMDRLTDISGSRAQTIGRTEARRGVNRGRLDAMGSQGVDKFEIVDGGTPTSCDECNTRNGMVVDAETADDLANRSHPNCTIDFVPALQGAEVDDDVPNDEGF